MLTVGSRGSDVRSLQLALAKAGYSPGTADGIFGNRTRAAVVAYQRSHKLSADGIVGPNTSHSIFGDWNKDRFDNGGGKPGVTQHGGAGSISPTASRHEKLMFAWNKAKAFGLTITSYTGGKHTPTSYHYQGRAIDVAGSPSAMARYYRYMSQFKPTELFYDPLGGIKNGQNIGAIGGHGDHVHIAF
jgi:peptidoglycan hydrolase-like protein with peptidoglycan-binding domain